MDLRKYSGDYTDLDVRYSYNKGMTRRYDESETRTKTNITFNSTFITDDGYFLTGIHKVYTVIRPNIIIVQGDDRRRITECINSVESSQTDRPVHSVIVNEDTLLASHRQNNIEVYNLNFNNQSNRITVIADTHSDNTENIEYIGDTISHLETEFSVNPNVSMYFLEEIEPSYPGYAYSGISSNQTYLYVQNQYFKEDNSIGIAGHEWVHAIQNYSYYPNASWTHEGLANYIGGLAEVNAGGNNRRIVNAMFEYGWNKNSTSIVLSNKSSWENNVEYNRGSRVSYLTDLAIRNHTNGNKTIIDFLKRMNSISKPVHHGDILNLVEQLAGKNYKEKFQQYVESNSTVKVEYAQMPSISYSDYDITKCSYKSYVRIISDCYTDTEN